MVDVSSKPETPRFAQASAVLCMQPETRARIEALDVHKGNVLATARIAGINAAKRTADLIPLCHPLRLDGVDLDFAFTDATTLRITASVRATDRTGVEMEALTAVTIAALTCYDMCKSLDRGMTIREVALVEKMGGASGHFIRTEAIRNEAIRTEAIRTEAMDLADKD